MPHKKLRLLFALCVLTCLVALSLGAQDHKPLLGQWNMTSETDSDSVHWNLVLKEVDGKLSASLTAGENNEMAAKEFSYAEGVLKFKVPYEGEEYDITLQADGPDKLKGTWSGGGDSGTTTGTRAK